MTFSFVLSDDKGDRVYVTSILFHESSVTPDGTGIVSFSIMSHYAFFNSFSICLQEIYSQWMLCGQQGDSAAEVSVYQERNKVNSFLHSLQIIKMLISETPLPLPGGPSVRCFLVKEQAMFSLPSEREFPLLDVSLYHNLFKVCDYE